MENAPKEMPDEKDKLRMENELRKAKLMLERGALFNQPDAGQEIPAGIEKNFLDQIEMFNEASAKGERITIFERIGRPAFTKPTLLSEEKTEIELDRLMQIMLDNGINIETICDVEPTEMYRFIVEEIFSNEIDDIRIPGMMLVFTYEEFHPNHAFDLRRYTDDFLKDLFNLDNDFYFRETYSGIKDEKKLHHLREAYSHFTTNPIDILSIEYDETTARVSANICVIGHIEDPIEKHLIQGECKLIFIRQYGYWFADEITLPATKLLK
jgi:hypothetical protein